MGAVIGCVAVLSGLIAFRGGRLWAVPKPAAFRRFLGVAMVTWGCGQLLKCALTLSGADPPFPAIGDLVNAAAVPIAVAGLLALPRAVDGTHPLVRVGSMPACSA